VNSLTVKRLTDTQIVVLTWISTRILTYLAAAAGSLAILRAADQPLVAYVELWNRWDSRWFESIATEGYVGTYVSDFEDFRYNVAFFPAVPVLMRLGTMVGLSTTATGMAVSFVAGLAASFALVRLTKIFGGQGKWGAIAWMVAPTAVFLSAAYTEALFAAFAFWAWVQAREGRWASTGVLAGFASLTRPNGIFLLLGLITMFLMSRPQSRTAWMRGLWLSLPVLAVMGYFAYLKGITGSWTAWNDAQRDFWQRHLVDPFTALANTYELIFTFSPTGEPSSRMITEIIAMAILVAVTIIMGLRKWWPEMVFAGATALSLGTSSMYHSVPRTLVVVFPLWILLGLWMTRSRFVRWTFVALGLPALLIVTMLFTQNQWIS